MHKRFVVPLVGWLVASCASAPAPKGGAEPGVYLSLRCKGATVSKGEKARFSAVFTNTTGQTVSILKPQRGSYAGDVSPVYRWHVTDTVAGREANLIQESGSRPPDTYSDSCRISLAPGSSATVPLSFPFELRKGEYSVWMGYQVGSSTVFEGRGALPDTEYVVPDMFVGTLASDTVRLKVSR